MENKILTILQQQERVLNGLNLEIENNKMSINAVEEWIKVDHGRNGMIAVIEENTKLKFNLIEKSTEIKIENITERLKYI
jgi:hypothetical protein